MIYSSLAILSDFLSQSDHSPHEILNGVKLDESDLPKMVLVKGAKTKVSCLPGQTRTLPPPEVESRGGSRVPGFWWKSIKKKQRRRRQWFPATAQHSTAFNAMHNKPPPFPLILLVASISIHSSSSLHSL